MCFHASIALPLKKSERRFKVQLNDEALRPQFSQPEYHLNGFAHPNVLIIPQEKPSVLAPGVWGIVPENKLASEINAYQKEAVRFGGGLNAQSEKLFEHFMYREVAMTRRCIIPVSGFFEPHTHKKKKYPFYIHQKNNEPLALAGIYTVIENYVTFAILTKAASPLFEKIHNLKKRQPLILDLDHAHNWLSSDLTETEVKTLVNYNFPEANLVAYPVSKALFSPKTDSNIEAITNQVVYDELKIT